MTRTYAAESLLRHGRLTHAEFRRITGWPDDVCHGVLRWLVKSGRAYFTEERGCRRRVYQLREDA